MPLPAVYSPAIRNWQFAIAIATATAIAIQSGFGIHDLLTAWTRKDWIGGPSLAWAWDL